MTDERAPTPTSTIHLDAAAIRALAHPLRSRLLTALRTDGPATATFLAQVLATNTGATSYHLRRLAGVGLVEETEAGRGRERWWRAASESHAWTERDVADDPDSQAASDWLRRFYLRTFVERYEAWLARQTAWPLEWREAAESFDAMVRVDATDLAALQAELMAVVARYRDPRPDDASARRAAVYVHLFPIDPEPR